VTIAREMRWDSLSQVLNQHSAPGQEPTVAEHSRCAPGAVSP
jgi:hypothetical protein